MYTLLFEELPPQKQLTILGLALHLKADSGSFHSNRPQSKLFFHIANWFLVLVFKEETAKPSAHATLI